MARRTATTGSTAGMLFTLLRSPAGLAVIIIVVIVLAFALVRVVQENKVEQENRLIAECWDTADSYFGQAQFQAAGRQYEEVIALVSEWEGQPSREKDLALAQVMRDACPLCDSLAKIPQLESTPLADQLNELDAIHERLATLLGNGESAPLTSDGSVESETFGDVQVQASGTKVALSARWSEVSNWVGILADDFGGKLKLQIAPQLNDIEKLELLIGFLEGYLYDVSPMKPWLPVIRERIEYNAAKESFEQASQAAVADLSERSIHLAAVRWENLTSRYSGLLKADSYSDRWVEHREALRTELKDRLNESDHQSTAGLSVEIKAMGPQILPIRQYTALLHNPPGNSTEVGEPLVFVLAADCCYGIEASTGHIQWVCQTGYDMRWLPRWVEHAGRELVTMSWDADGQETVTVASADRLQPLWSWQPGEGVSLASPPEPLEGRLYVLLESGELWQFDLLTGEVQSRLVLPESIASPMVLREDKQGVLIVGRSLGVYMLELADRPQIQDIIFLERDRDTIGCRGIWIPPYVVVAENALNDSCQIVVFSESDNGFKRVQREELSGRLWQSPEVQGALFLVATDQHTEVVFGLDLGSPNNPLYQVSAHQGPKPPFIDLPRFLSRPEAPFVLMTGSKIECFSVDTLRRTTRWNRKITWEHILPDDDYVSTQALQCIRKEIVLASKQPGRNAVKVRCLALDSGTTKWEVDVGNPAIEFFEGTTTDRGYSRLLARSESGDLFELQATPDGVWSSQPLRDVAANSTVVWATGSSSLFCVEPDPPTLHRMSLSGEEQPGGRPLGAKAVSPLAVHEQGVRPVLEETANQVNWSGPWVVFVDANRRVQLLHMEDPPQRTQFLQLTADVPKTGWHRPIWIRGQGVLLAHPGGTVILAEVSLTGGVAYLRQTASTLTSEIVGAPLVLEGRLWLSGRDRVCRALDLTTLALLEGVSLPAGATTGPVECDFGIAIGLGNGQVAVIADDGQDRQSSPPSVSVSSDSITYLTSVQNGRQLLVTDSRGGVFSIDRQLRIRQVASTRAPASASPVSSAGGVLIGTSHGSLELVPTSSLRD